MKMKAVNGGVNWRGYEFRLIPACLYCFDLILDEVCIYGSECNNTVL